MSILRLRCTTNLTPHQQNKVLPHSIIHSVPPELRPKLHQLEVTESTAPSVLGWAMLKDIGQTWTNSSPRLAFATEVNR